MNTLVSKFAATVSMAFMCCSTQAARLSLIYTGSGNLNNDGALIAAAGDLVSFEVWMDFTDNPTIGGGFDVHFNSVALEFESLERTTNCSDPDCGGWREPEVSDGLIQDWRAGDFNDGLAGPLALGLITFTFLEHDFSQPFLEMATSSGLGGPFVSFDDFTVIDVDYGSFELAPVPLPATFWLMLAALGWLRAWSNQFTQRRERG